MLLFSDSALKNLKQIFACAKIYDKNVLPPWANKSGAQQNLCYSKLIGFSDRVVWIHTFDTNQFCSVYVQPGVLNLWASWFMFHCSTVVLMAELKSPIVTLHTLIDLPYVLLCLLFDKSLISLKFIQQQQKSDLSLQC